MNTDTVDYSTIHIEPIKKYKIHAKVVSRKKHDENMESDKLSEIMLSDYVTINFCPHCGKSLVNITNKPYPIKHCHYCKKCKLSYTHTLPNTLIIRYEKLSEDNYNDRQNTTH